MAFDQVSLFLHPPRWQRHSVADPLMVHFSGEPVQCVSDVRDKKSSGPTVRFDELCHWFGANGFEVTVHGADSAEFHSATPESVGSSRPEIHVYASEEGEEVSGLFCRFRLTRQTPLRLRHWAAFIQELCTKFAFRISVSDTESVGPEEFLTVIRRTDNWRHFAEQFGWTEPTESQPTVPL